MCGSTVRYRNKLDCLALDFLKRLLVLDPAKRVSAADALLHPYVRHLEEGVGRERLIGKRVFAFCSLAIQFLGQRHLKVA